MKPMHPPIEWGDWTIVFESMIVYIDPEAAERFMESRGPLWKRILRCPGAFIKTYRQSRNFGYTWSVIRMLLA